MSHQQWHFVRDGERIGPFTWESLSQLVNAGMIQPDTILVDSDGNSTAAASALTASLPVLSVSKADITLGPCLFAPPPPPPPYLPVSSAVVTQQPSQPWDPLTIAWLGLIFSPIWVGIMSVINARRLHLSIPIWQAVTINGAWIVLDVMLGNWLFDSHWATLVLYFATVWLMWHLALQPQAAAYEQSTEKKNGSLSWLIPSVLGLPLALFTFFAFVISPQLPLSPRDVCQKFMRCSTLSQIQRLTTANLWPALKALDQLKEPVAGGTYEFTEEGAAPAEHGGYLVGYRTYSEAKGKGDTVDGAFHLVDREGHWKIEEVYFTGINGQAAEQWIALSRNYEQIVAEGRAGRTVASIQPVANAGTDTRNPTSNPVDNIVKYPQVWMGLKAFFATATAKKIGGILVAIGVLLTALCRPKTEPTTSEVQSRT